MNQILHIPTGLYVYQQMHSNFWRADNARLAKFSLTSNDSCGNTYKEARRGAEIFAYQWHTYWDGMAAGMQKVTLPPNGFFYDELPLRVRTIDFSKPSGDFEIQLAPSIINSKKDELSLETGSSSFRIHRTGYLRDRCSTSAGAISSCSIAIFLTCFAPGKRPTAAAST